MNPKLKSSKDVKKIMTRLTQKNEKNFTEKYKLFLDEKTISNTTGKLQYTHPRIRSDYRSLRRNLSYLFINNTTDLLEGGVFSHMKNMIS